MAYQISRAQYVGGNKKRRKVGKVMREFQSGTLRSGSGQKVTNPKQGLAIALREAGIKRKR